MVKSKFITYVVLGIIAILLSVAGTITLMVDEYNKDKIDKENSIMVNDVWQEVTADAEEDIVLENQDENNTIGTIKIEKIELEAPIKEGTDLETLKEYVGHFANSNIWDGNVALAAHNRGSAVEPYFSRINELVNGDSIIYQTKLGEKTYKVTEIKEIEHTDWSVTEGNTEDKNTITLITCITNHPEKRLCVIAEEII